MLFLFLEILSKISNPLLNSIRLKIILNKPHVAFITNLCVDYGGHPEAFGRPGHRQHRPEEDEYGQDEGEEGSRHDVVEDDDKVAQHL